MNINPLKLTIIFFALLTFNSFSQNMYVGDTSAEAETDTLTRGNYSCELVPYSWDKTSAFDGKRSIRIDWDRKKRYITTSTSSGINWLDKWISVANTPNLKVGESYTFSFYVKASADKYPLRLKLLPCAGWAFYTSGGNYTKNLVLSSKWKRYSLTFVAKMKPQAFQKGYSAILDFSRSPVGKVWYDAIQIEKGKVATPYKNPSPINVGVSLNSQNWSNIYMSDDPIIATMRVVMPEGKAMLQCKVVDYQGKIVKDFEQAVKGSNEIKLSLDPKRFGWFKVTATLLSDGKAVSSHSVNYIRIAEPVNVVSGIQPFAGIVNYRGIDQFDLLKKIGAKRVQVSIKWDVEVEKIKGKFDWSAIEWQLKRGKKFGMVNKVMISPFSAPKWLFDKKELAMAKKMTKKQWLVLTPDKHKYWREVVGELTRRYGDLIDEIELGAEDNGRLGRSEYYKSLYPQHVKNGFLVGGKPFDDLCEMVKVAAAEIRKTHPKMQIGAIRPSRSSDNWLFVKSMFRKIGKDFNVFPLDFYFYPYSFGPEIKRRRGKSDGLIKVYDEAKKITQTLGCNQPIYMSEFGWQPDIRFPDDSIYRWEQAEAMAKDFIVARAAGFYAFDWFKGFSRFTVGNYSWHMQQNMKIQSIAASYSAVARVVENVTESKWLTPDNFTRIAIMRKHDGKGVAAVWSDTGYQLLLPKTNAALNVTDLMGNPLKLGSGQFTLSTAPIYIWHHDFKELCNILSKANVEMTNFCDIKFRMVSKDLGRLQFVNLSNRRDIKINAKIHINGKDISRTIDVPGGSTNTCDIPLSGKNIKVKACISGTKTVIEKSFSTSVLIPIESGSSTKSHIGTVAARGDISNPEDPWVAWTGPDDLSAQISSSWDAKNLYIKCKVKDDLHHNKFITAPWKGDSLQIAIDPKNDGSFYVMVSGKKLGPDDFEFVLALGDDGKKRCIKSYGKNICQAKDYKIIRDEKEKTTTYNLQLPWKSLGVKPFKGMIFGMSFVIFDDDTGSGQTYYAPIGSGIAGTKKPALYNKYLLK